VLPARRVKLAAITSPQEDTTPPVSAIAVAIPLRCPSCYTSSRIRAMVRMLKSSPNDTRKTKAKMVTIEKSGKIQRHTFMSYHHWFVIQ